MWTKRWLGGRFLASEVSADCCTQEPIRTQEHLGSRPCVQPIGSADLSKEHLQDEIKKKKNISGHSNIKFKFGMEISKSPRGRLGPRSVFAVHEFPHVPSLRSA